MKVPKHLPWSRRGHLLSSEVMSPADVVVPSLTASRGGIPGSFLEPLGRSFSDFAAFIAKS